MPTATTVCTTLTGTRRAVERLMTILEVSEDAVIDIGGGAFSGLVKICGGDRWTTERQSTSFVRCQNTIVELRPSGCLQWGCRRRRTG